MVLCICVSWDQKQRLPSHVPVVSKVGANKATDVGLTPDEAGSLHVLGPARSVDNQDLREFGRF